MFGCWVNTAPTVDMRFLFRFSPRPSRTLRFPVTDLTMGTPLPSTEAINSGPLSRAT